jgi:hypothetical protein
VVRFLRWRPTRALDLASGAIAKPRGAANLYTHSADRPPPQAHTGAKVKAPFGRYNFPLAVRPRADEPPPPANPWASVMLRKEQSA